MRVKCVCMCLCENIQELERETISLVRHKLHYMTLTQPKIFSCMKIHVCIGDIDEGIKGDNSQLLNYLKRWGHALVEKWRQTRSISMVPFPTGKTVRMLFEKIYWFLCSVYVTLPLHFWESVFLGEKSLNTRTSFSLFFLRFSPFLVRENTEQQIHSRGKHWNIEEKIFIYERV